MRPRFLESILHDIRFGFRMLRKHPGTTAVALLSIALGVGANTAIFSVIYGVLISPYPYARPHEIWAPEIRATVRQQGRGSHRVNELLEIVNVPAFAEVMATGFDSVLLTGDNRAPESLGGVQLTGSAFNFLGVPPILGRTIQPSDVHDGGEVEPVAVLSHRLWLRLFNGEADAIGKTLRLNDRVHTVIGVMPPRFGWYGNDGLWLPMPMDRNSDRMVNVIVRLRPGVSKEVGQEQLHALHLLLAEERPDTFPKDGFTTTLTNYMEVTVASGEMRSSLLLLFGTVGFLLLIACANVANLQLARSSARAREIAVRTALGARGRRIFQQLLTESVLLSLIGGALGVLFAIGATRAIVAYMPEFYTPNEARVTVNYWVLLFTAAIAVLTGILSGLAPALRNSRSNLTESLKDSARGTGTGVSGKRIRNLLVVTEVALAVILLVGASLTIRSFVVMNRVDLGFRSEGVLLVGIPLPPKRYQTIDQRNAFSAQLLERVTHLPGVQAVTIGTGALPFGGWNTRFTIEGQPRNDSQRMTLAAIGTGYLKTLAVPLRTGREFTEQEVALGDRVALINETAKRLWPEGENPIGRRIQLDLLEKPPNSMVVIPAGSSGSVTVVGVVADTRNSGLQRNTQPAVYVPYSIFVPSQLGIALRTTGDPTLLINSLREQVRAIDPDQPLRRPITMEEAVGSQFLQPRFNMALFGMFAIIGLFLTLAGIYSVLSYDVTQMTHEIGLRMALGADRQRVLRHIIGVGAKLVAVGLVIGLVAALMLTRFMRTLLFQITPNDPIAIVGVVVVLSLAALLACYIPARRAAGLDPWVALRRE